MTMLDRTGRDRHGRDRHRLALSLLVIGGVLVASSCRSGKSLSSAGYPNRTKPATTTTVAATAPPAITLAPGVTLAPGDTLPVATTSTVAPTDPPTTLPRPLDSLPKCNTSVLDTASASGPVNITFWHGLANELGTELQTLTDQYNASQNKVHVNLEFQGGYDQTIDKYLQSNQDNRPDMVQMPEYMVQQMIDTKSTVPTQACAESDSYDLSKFIPQTLRAYASQSVQWSMPFNVSLPVLFYLKPRFVAAGLDPDNPPQTLDELLAACKQIVASKASAKSISLDSDFDGGGGWFIEQWLAKAGEFYADNQNGRAAPATKVLYDGAAGVQLLTFLKSLVTDGGAAYVGDNASGTDTLLKLADKDAPAAMTIATSASLGPVLAFVKGGIIPGITADQVGVSYMPGPGGGLGGLVGGASLYIVNKGDAKAAAAWDYMKFLDSAQSQSTWAAATGYVPVRTDALDLDPIKTVYVSDPRFKVPYDQLLGSKDAPTSEGPVIGPLLQVRKVTAAAVATVLQGGDPQAALTSAAQQADDLISNYAAQNGG